MLETKLICLYAHSFWGHNVSTLDGDISNIMKSIII